MKRSRSSMASWYRCSGDFENDLSRFTGFDRANCLLRALERKAVRDHRRRIELSASQEARHLMPRVVHAAADNAVDGDSLEDHFGGEVHVHGLGGNTQHLHAA